MKRLLTILLVVVVGLLTWSLPAWATAPSNDLISHATQIAALPFVTSETTAGAHADGPICYTRHASVFFKFRPSTTTKVVADTFGSDYDTVLSVWTGPLSNLVKVACNNDAAFFTFDSAVHLKLQAGKSYIFEVSSFGGSGSLNFSLEAAPTEAPTATLDFQSGTADPASGVATIAGSIDCNHHMDVIVVGTLREVVNSTFEAYGFLELDDVVCPSSGTVDWSVDVEPAGDIAFVPGNAKVYFQYALDDGIATIVSTRDSAPVTLS